MAMVQRTSKPDSTSPKILEQCAALLKAVPSSDEAVAEALGSSSESRRLFFRFRRTGFVVVKNVLSKPVLEALRRELQDQRTGRVLEDLENLDDLDSSDWAIPFNLRKKSNPAIQMLCSLRPLRETMAALLETDGSYLDAARLLIGAPGAGRFQKWHKDLGGIHANIPMVSVLQARHLAFSIPLFADTALRLVPGSHYRQPSDSELEYAYLFRKLPLWSSIERARKMDPGMPGNMPGSVRIRQQAGDLIVYHRHLWQASLLQPGLRRCTLHGRFCAPEASSDLTLQTSQATPLQELGLQQARSF